MLCIGYMVGDSDSGVRQATGCLTHLIGGSILQSVLLGLLIFFLMPIMMGGDSITPLPFVKTLAWPIIKASLIALIAIFIISMMPIIGGMVANIPGLDVFLQGLIIFRIFSVGFVEMFLESVGMSADIYPGFWHTIGYFVISIAVSLLCFFASMALGYSTSDSEGRVEKTITFLQTMAAANLVNILPIFMYANYVAMSVNEMAG